MALRDAQKEMALELFLRSFCNEQDKDIRYELLIQFEDAFEGSIEGWKEKIANRIDNVTLRDEFYKVISRKEGKETNSFKDLCKIEPLVKEDLGQISYLAAKNLDMMSWSAFYEEDSMNDFIQQGYSFTVKRENVIVGFALAYKCPTYGGLYYIYLDTFIVNKDAQGQGIGRMMMDHLRKKAKKDHIYKIKLMTTKDRPAYQIYKHLGFEDIDTYVHMQFWG